MIKILLTILIIILAIIAILALIVLGIYFKLKRSLKQAGVKDLFKEIKQSTYEIKNNEKSISGMTSLLEPRILKDFPNFNKNELFTLCEKNLRLIFDSIENKNVDGLSSMPLLSDTVSKFIEDIKEENKEIDYANIVFHKFAIKNYEKKDGAATIEISTSLKYSYKEMKNSKILVNEDLVQTRYNCKFIYVYDVKNFNKSELVFGINCPNCGASINKLGVKSCSYCHSHIEDVNLKAWQMSSFKEY